jgi:hypothetical protein
MCLCFVYGLHTTMLLCWLHALITSRDTAHHTVSYHNISHAFFLFNYFIHYHTILYDLLLINHYYYCMLSLFLSCDPQARRFYGSKYQTTTRYVLCCAVLCCAVLCCAVLCCAVLCCAVLCCAVLCCAVLCCAVLCCAVLCCAVLCCAVLCSTTLLYFALLHSTLRYVMCWGMAWCFNLI